MRNILLVLSLAFSFGAFAEVKIGLVNIQKIMVSTKEGKSVSKTLEKSFKAKQKQLDAEKKAIVSLQEKFKKQDAVLSDTAKMKKSQEIAKKMEMARRKAAQFEQDIRKQEAELKKPILEKLKPIIDQISKQEKVSMTFEVTASPVVYAASKIDLTDKVIKAYDKKHSK